MSTQFQMSWKSICTIMFMTTTCLYAIVSLSLSLLMDEGFYFYIPLTFVIHLMILTLVVSGVWMVSFGYIKSYGFVARYLLFLAVTAALFATSMLVPIINFSEGHYLWIACGFIVSFGMGTGLSIQSEKHFKATGKRSVLLWEFNK